MAKPTIVTRAGKGSALTWTEGDSNLTNLRDATITIQAGTSGTNVVSDLNGTVTLVAGTNVTLSGDNTAKTITINSTASGGATTLDGLSDVVVPTPATNDVLQFDGTNWVDVAPSTLTVGNVSGTVALANGGTGQTSAPAALAALMGFTTTATAAGTTLLTNTSTHYQIFTGTTTQTVRVPDTSTLATGWSFHICNNSTGNLTITTSASNFIITALPGTTIMATCINTGSNAATSWEVGLTDFSTATGTGSVVLSTSPTLTTPNLGTPSAIVLTNASGTASININGTVGATTPAAGDFTSIGATTPGSGNFTNLTASTSVSGTGFNNYLASPPAIGGTAAAAGSFTTLTVRAANDLRLSDTDSSHYVGFKAPATVTTNRIWTLPAADGTNGQVLSTNGSGTLSWATAGGGGGLQMAVVEGTLTFQEFTNMSTAETTMPHTWTEKSDPNSLVTVSTDTVTITNAGTYLLEYDNNFNLYIYSASNSAQLFTEPEMTIKLYNSSDATSLGLTRYGGQKAYYNTTGSQPYESKKGNARLSSVVTITGSKSFTIRYGITAGSGLNSPKFVYTYSPNLPQLKITKLS